MHPVFTKKYKNRSKYIPIYYIYNKDSDIFMLRLVVQLPTLCVKGKQIKKHWI